MVTSSLAVGGESCISQSYYRLWHIRTNTNIPECSIIFRTAHANQLPDQLTGVHPKPHHTLDHSFNFINYNVNMRTTGEKDARIMKYGVSQPEAGW